MEHSVQLSKQSHKSSKIWVPQDPKTGLLSLELELMSQGITCFRIDRQPRGWIAKARKIAEQVFNVFAVLPFISSLCLGFIR